MKIYTRTGDDGTTGLLYGGRVRKDDPRTDLYGTVDETVSCLGLARAAGLVARIDVIVVRLQRAMFVLAAQLATAATNQSKLADGISRITEDMTRSVEVDIDELVAIHPLPNNFVLPGATLGAAGLDLARATVRRAERKAVALQAEGVIEDAEILRFLNRASDLLFVLARHEEAERGTPAKPSRVP
jgi:cob(I)alamin adenosyltransferase